MDYHTKNKLKICTHSTKNDKIIKKKKNVNVYYSI